MKNKGIKPYKTIRFIFSCLAIIFDLIILFWGIVKPDYALIITLVVVGLPSIGPIYKGLTCLKNKN